MPIRAWQEEKPDPGTASGSKGADRPEKGSAKEQSTPGFGRNLIVCSLKSDGYKRTLMHGDEAEHQLLPKRFEIDEDRHKLPRSRPSRDKTLYWLSRPSGTYSFQGRDVFLKDCRQPDMEFHGRSRLCSHAHYTYMMELSESTAKSGSLYGLDLPPISAHIQGAGASLN